MPTRHPLLYFRTDDGGTPRQEPTPVEFHPTKKGAASLGMPVVADIIDRRGTYVYIAKREKRTGDVDDTDTLATFLAGNLAGLAYVFRDIADVGDINNLHPANAAAVGR